MILKDSLRSATPPGEAKRRLRELIPFNVPIHSRNGGLLKIPIIYKLFTHAIVLDIHANHWKSQVTRAIMVHNGLKGKYRGVCQRLFTGTEGERLRKIKEIELETIVDSVETSELTSIGRCGGIAAT